MKVKEATEKKKTKENERRGGGSETMAIVREELVRSRTET